MLSYSSHRRA